MPRNDTGATCTENVSVVEKVLFVVIIIIIRMMMSTDVYTHS